MCGLEFQCFKQSQWYNPMEAIHHLCIWWGYWPNLWARSTWVAVQRVWKLKPSMKSFLGYCFDFFFRRSILILRTLIRKIILINQKKLHDVTDFIWLLLKWYWAYKSCASIGCCLFTLEAVSFLFPILPWGAEKQWLSQDHSRSQTRKGTHSYCAPAVHQLLPKRAPGAL